MTMTRTMKRASFGLFAAGLLGVAGCPATSDDLCARGTCEPTADQTLPGDAGGDGIVVAPRDPCVDDPKAPSCVDEKAALFVSRSADPAVADGSIARPFASIRTALEKVTSDKKRVYVCEGTYEEQVSIEKVPVTLIGGLACDFRTDAPKPKIAPAAGIALSIAAVGGASVVDVAVAGASSPNERGSSAIAIFVTGAKDILLRRVEATAGDAQPGAPGDGAAPNWSGAAQTANGGTGANGGEAPACGKCADGVTFSAGGRGGTASGAIPTSGSASPAVGAANAGANAATCVPGTGGANGLAPEPAEGSARPGVLMATSWNTETSAKPGSVGNPGQGGGGGGANATAGGGSGGCGGCGGGGGAPGGNGGSSIALLVHRSEITVEDSKLAAGAGGAGGPGGDGADGQAPSGGGGGICSGGPGGYGSGGGGGGGGAGGHSAAVAHVGAAPVIDPTTQLAKASPGPPGQGGEPGAPADPSGNEGSKGKPGGEGAAADVLPLD